MKKIAVLAALLVISIGVTAQDYKPLEKVEVPDYPTNKITISENTSLATGHTYYTAQHSLFTRTISAELGVPLICDLSIKITEAEIPQGTTIKTSIGEENYYFTAGFVYEEKIYADIDKEHIKHIAVSGIQSMTFILNGQVILVKNFNAIEQELWRRTAEELCKTLDKFKVL